MKSPEFVRQRIQWCAKKHGVPFKNTGFWDEVPAALGQTVPTTLLSPVVFSMCDSGEATVIGVNEVFVLLKSGTQRVCLDDLVGVTSPCLRQSKRKSEFDAIELESTSGQRLRLPTERGRGCFALWNILLMLIRMIREGEPDGAATRSQPVRLETNRVSPAGSHR
jgi:hypothetical protein